jgi:hypothetical protein
VRAGWVLFAAACAPPPPPPVLEATAPTAEVCDVARWHERASAPLRARIGSFDVAVVAEHGERAEVVVEWPRGVLLGGMVSERRFERVVVRETSIAPGVFVEPGVAVDDTGAVQTANPIVADGRVAAGAIGRMWTRRAVPDAPFELSHEVHVYAKPDVMSDGVAIIAAGYRVIDRMDDAGNGWLAIEAHDASARVIGFARPIMPTGLAGTYDFSDDTIEGDLVRPEPPRPTAAAGCLYASPDVRARVVGVSDGTLIGKPAGNGWIEVRLAAPWGRIVGYGRAAASSER